MNATVEKHVQNKIREHKEFHSVSTLQSIIESSWGKIAPSWPLKNMIATNPLSGLVHLPFADALQQASVYFQQSNIPEQIEEVNRLSIKWLQAFFDDGQATIKMPMRHLGLLKSTLRLIRYDNEIIKKDKDTKQLVEDLPEEAHSLISLLLKRLNVKENDSEIFITLLLTTLPGWASYIKYQTEWSYEEPRFNITGTEYIAFRLLLAYLIWPSAIDLISWHKSSENYAYDSKKYKSIQENEYHYQQHLLRKLSNATRLKKYTRPKAQFIFCIDVRSEPYRRAIEEQGEFETFGFAGFFGVPIKIHNNVTGEAYASCPVLLQPAHSAVAQTQLNSHKLKFFRKSKILKHIYQSLKYNFTSPFSLVEIMGSISGLWMVLKSCVPKSASFFSKMVSINYATKNITSFSIENMPIHQQVEYAINSLKLMGLTKNFAPVVVFCGHGSTSHNNAYAKALDCGACGGQRGGPNAQVIVAILNSKIVRLEISSKGIYIPDDCLFVAAEHNTTTDELHFFDDGSKHFESKLEFLKEVGRNAQKINAKARLKKMGLRINKNQCAIKTTSTRSLDWAQVRPEWGLARNAAFIVGPRDFTESIDLDGRVFLHSYDWQIDQNLSLLNTILTAPMIVAQWINAQYLFSTLDNAAYGGGSKVTKNITGKFGVMQGNASDLMSGLPLQSVFAEDLQEYHIPARLTVIVHAPPNHVHKVVMQNDLLVKLFQNQWLYLICFDPLDKCIYKLEKNLSWQKHQ